MHRDRLLAAISAVQLTLGLAGLGVAVKRRHAWHFLFLRGRPENMVRDALSMGTALSAPSPMLVAQGVATAPRAHWDRVDSPIAAAGLGLAALMAVVAFTNRRP